MTRNDIIAFASMNAASQTRNPYYKALLDEAMANDGYFLEQDMPSGFGTDFNSLIWGDLQSSPNSANSSYVQPNL